MCLYTYDRRPMRAQNDIICYKVVWKTECLLDKYPVLSIDYGTDYSEADCVSQFQNYPYAFGKLNKLSFLHRFRGIPDLIYDSSGIVEIYSVYFGFHSYVNFPKCTSRFKVVVCTIPKGAKYFVDRSGKEYCSNRLIVNGFVDHPVEKPGHQLD